jgi:hypothetical protein
MKKLLNVLALGAFGFGLAACNGGNAINTTPVSTPAPATYKQIELLSRPAVKELFEKFVDHQTTNVVEPYADPTLQASISGLTDALRPKLAAAGSTDYGAVIASVLYPNWITADVSQTGGATYLGYEITPNHAAFGGRQLTDDVIDTSLGVVFGKTLVTLGLAVEDNQENNCLTKDNVAMNVSQAPIAAFPYLHAPH